MERGQERFLDAVGSLITYLEIQFSFCDLNVILREQVKINIYIVHFTATEASVKKSLGNDKVADGDLKTCDWIHKGNEVLLEFEKKFQMYSIKMFCEAPYKGTRLLTL